MAPERSPRIAGQGRPAQGRQRTEGAKLGPAASRDPKTWKFEGIDVAESGEEVTDALSFPRLGQD